MITRLCMLAETMAYADNEGCTFTKRNIYCTLLLHFAYSAYTCTFGKGSIRYAYILICYAGKVSD